MRFSDIEVLLVSKSPRRLKLLKDIGYKVRQIIKDIQEIYPENLPKDKVPEYLAVLKADSVDFLNDLEQNQVLLACDTVVILGNTILNKPKDIQDAKHILSQLSGKTHQVVSGVSLRTPKNQLTFTTTTYVTFNTLESEIINFYIDNYKPFDKAGAYAIQEFIGMVGISSIHGDYYNVVGLPINEVVKNINNILYL